MLRCGRGTHAGAHRAADQRTRQDAERRHGAEQGARTGADAAAGHGALAPGVAAGGDTEKDGGENEYLGHDVKLPVCTSGKTQNHEAMWRKWGFNPATPGESASI